MEGLIVNLYIINLSDRYSVIHGDNIGKICF